MSQQVALNDVLQVEAWIFDSAMQQAAVIRRYWKVTAKAGSGDLSFGTIATAVDAVWAPNWIAIIYNGARYQGTRCRRLFPVSDDAWMQETGGAGDGTGGAVALPTQASGIIHLGSLSVGKHGQGRVYVPFPAQAANETVGQPTDDYVSSLTAIGTGAIGLTINVTGGGTATCTITPQLWNKAANTGKDITEAFGKKAWATQKRRGAFGRFNRPPF